MFINQFLIKNLGAKEHFFFDINKYFSEKSAFGAQTPPNCASFLAFFRFFVGSLQIILLLLYGIKLNISNHYDIYRKS